MNDVVGGIVVTPRNVNFLAKYFVVITATLGPGFHGAQIRPRTGLRQVHGARPFTTVNLTEVNALETVAAMSTDGQRSSGTQKRLKGKCHIGAIPHLASCRAIQLGKALATRVLIGGNAHPSTSTQLLNGFGVSG